MEPLLRDHLDRRSTPLERSLDNINLNISVLIFTHDERPLILKGHISGGNRVGSQEGFHCIKKLSKLRLTDWHVVMVVFLACTLCCPLVVKKKE